MMLPTHALVGLAIATPVAVGVPDLSTSLLVGALVGSILPDVDVLATHRRTLHYPTGYVLASVPVLAVAALAPTPIIVALAAGLVAAAIHCRMDRYGGSHENRPWERKTDRAVYDHLAGRWRGAKRWTRYDGSSRDLAVAATAAAVPLLAPIGAFRTLAAVSLGVAVVYTAFRRRIADLVDELSVALRRGSDRLRAGCDRR